MKKNKSIIILLAILLLSSLVYYSATIISKKEKGDDGTATNVTNITLVDKDPSDLISVSVSSEESNYCIKHIEGAYYLEKDLSFPLNQTFAELIFENVSKIESSRLISEDKNSFSEYGLDEPLYLVSVSYDDGKSFVLKIGSNNKYSGGYYLNLDSDNKVYLVSEDFVNELAYTEKELLKDDEIVETDEGFDAVISINVQLSEKSDYTLKLISKDNEDGETSYEWHKLLDSGAISDEDFSEEAQAIYNQIVKFNPENWVTYNITEDSQLAEYGLLSPYAKVTVTYTETVLLTDSDSGTSDVTETTEKTFGVTIGNLLSDSTEENPERYLMINNGKIVYIAAESDFSQIF